MELVGEQKRIQALFSELRLADEQAAPLFAGVWNRAQARTLRTVRPRAFNLSFVAATALLVVAFVSLAALWARYSQRNAPAAVTADAKAAVPATNNKEGPGPLALPDRRR